MKSLALGGNYGHAGRPGQRGGSSAREDDASRASKAANDAETEAADYAQGMKEGRNIPGSDAKTSKEELAKRYDATADAHHKGEVAHRIAALSKDRPTASYHDKVASSHAKAADKFAKEAAKIRGGSMPQYYGDTNPRAISASNANTHETVHYPMKTKPDTKVETEQPQETALALSNADSLTLLYSKLEAENALVKDAASRTVPKKAGTRYIR